MFDQCLTALACIVRAYSPQQSVEIRVGKRGNQYKSCTNSDAWMGLLAYSVLNICTNFCTCIYYCRCHLFHLQSLCHQLPGCGSHIYRLHYLIHRPSQGSSAWPLSWRGWSWSVKGAEHGGCCICSQQMQQWNKFCNRRHRIRSVVRVRSPAASEHPIKTEACVEHIPPTRRSIWWQPDVLPRGAYCLWSTRSRLRA